MRYAKLKYNDTVNGEGICVSLWTQYCPHRCSGCFNPETWDPNGGFEVPENLKWRLIEAISANGIQRGFSILGGEPLAPQNLKFVEEMVAAVRTAYPRIKIFLWTGYTMEELKESEKTSDCLHSILNNIDVLVDGPFIQEQKDLTLKMRGSKNQRIWRKLDGKWTWDANE